MNRKVSKYLNSKDKLAYSCLDNILSYYLNGELECLLLDRQMSRIGIFPSISKTGNSIQVCFDYYNMSAILLFSERYFEYCLFEAEWSADEIERSIIKEQYSRDFDIQAFIINYTNTLKNDSRLTVRQNAPAQDNNKKKIFYVISEVSLCVPFVIICLLAIYVFVLNKTIVLNEWFLLLIIIPLIMWFVFFIKSRK